MATFYVETYRPAFPDKGVYVRAHRINKTFTQDVLSPCMTALFRVENVKTKSEAIACVIEKAAGKPVSVYRISDVEKHHASQAKG